MLEHKPTILFLYSKMMPAESSPDTLFAGGAQKRVFQMADYFSSHGYNVLLGSDDTDDNRFVQELKKNDVEHLRIPFRSGVSGQIMTVQKLLHRISEHKVDLIHCNDRWTSLFGFLSSKFSGVPFIYTARNEFNDKKITGRLFGQNIIAISEGVKHNLVDFFGIAPTKIQIIYNGSSISHSSLEAQRVVREKFNLDSKDRVISVIGRLSEQKGLNFLLKASVDVLKDFSNLKILFVGDGELREELISEAMKLGLEKNVIFCGNQEDVAAFIDICEFTVISSIWEGLGVSAIESMMLGKPVIATRVGGLPEVVENGETGLLVPPGDFSALANAISCFLTNPKGVSEMGVRAEVKARKEFSLEQMLEEYSDYYNEILREKNI